MAEEIWTVLRVLRWTTDYFRQQGIEGGRLDAELLLADALQLDRVGLYLNFDRPLSTEELALCRARVARRARREPLQYILGRAEFWSRSLRVTPAVLIPRPDTEVLVEEALAHLTGGGCVLDVGTGSGAIAIAIAGERPEAQVEGVDVSAEALAVAAENVRDNRLVDRVSLRRADLAQLDGGPFDLVVANPPYIAEGEMGALMPEVRDFEPALALCGGADGLESYRQLARQAQRLLHPGGWLLVEVGVGQAGTVGALFSDAGLIELYNREDYAGIPRVVGSRRPPSG